MLIQSSSGKVYAVFCATDRYELSILPQLTLVSTTCMIQLRLRFKDKKADLFDPMLCPKIVLTDAVERSKNTLRGKLVLNTGITIDHAPKAFPEIASKMILTELPKAVMTKDSCLYAAPLRDDFVADFGKLLENQWAAMYPPKYYSSHPKIMTFYDLAFMKADAAETGPKLQAVSGGVQDQGDKIVKPTFGGASGALTTGVDEPDAGDDH